MAAVILLGQPALAEEGEGPWTTLLIAGRAVVTGRSEAVRQRLETIPETKRTDEATAILALTHLIAGRTADGRALLEKVTSSAPTVAEGHYWLAVASLRLGDTRRALGALDVAVSLDPDRPVYRLARGLTHAAAGQRADAVDDVLAAARLEPNLLVPSYHPDERRGVLHFVESGLRRHPDQEMVDEAVTMLFFDAGLMLEARRRAEGSKTAVAHEILGRLALRDSALDKSVKLLERAATERPRSAQIQFDLARAAYRHGDTTRALAALREAARLEPGDARVQTALGDLYLEQGDLEHAELAFGYAIAEKLDPLALAGLGRTLELQGDIEGALRNYRKSVNLAPFAVEPLERLARLLERQNGADVEAKTLRRRLKTAMGLEREVEGRVKALKDSATAHAAACDLIDQHPEEALKKIASLAKVDPAARALARAGALVHAGREAQGRQQAGVFLGSLSASRWARGARPSFVLRRKIGSIVVTRVIPLDYVPL